MTRYEISVSQIVFDKNGHTLWVHDHNGGTAFRLKTMHPARIQIQRCAPGGGSHGDAITMSPIKICLGENAKATSCPTQDEIRSALQDILNWGRSHTSPLDQNSPHEILTRIDALLSKMPP